MHHVVDVRRIVTSVYHVGIHVLRSAILLIENIKISAVRRYVKGHAHSVTHANQNMSAATNALHAKQL